MPALKAGSWRNSDARHQSPDRKFVFNTSIKLKTLPRLWDVQYQMQGRRKGAGKKKAGTPRNPRIIRDQNL
jgi:hypothetical protein